MEPCNPVKALMSEGNERACSMLFGGLGSPKDLRKGHGSVLDAGTPFL